MLARAGGLGKHAITGFFSGEMTDYRGFGRHQGDYWPGQSESLAEKVKQLPLFIFGERSGSGE